MTLHTYTYILICIHLLDTVFSRCTEYIANGSFYPYSLLIPMSIVMACLSFVCNGTEQTMKTEQGCVKPRKVRFGIFGVRRFFLHCTSRMSWDLLGA